MVSDLMAKVAEKGAVRLAHLDAAPFSLDFVGLGEGYRDNAILMTGHDFLRVRVGEEVEDKPMCWILSPGPQREAPAQQRVEEAVLGGFEPTPTGKIGRYGQIRDRPIMPTGQTKPAAFIFRQQPIACFLSCIEAEKPLRAAIDGAEARTLGFQGQQGLQVRIITQRVAAMDARPVLEIYNVAASLAGKDLHGRSIC